VHPSTSSDPSDGANHHAATPIVVDRPASGWSDAVDQIPARPGVVALEDHTGAAQLLGTTADTRAFCTRRLLATGADARADLGGITSRVSVTPVESAFEADLVYLALARERMPRAHRQHMARAALAFVRLDPASSAPHPVVLEAEQARGVEVATLLGPVLRTKAASFAEGLVDAFDLCRYPSVLAQAPAGVPCAYKEMGRCPAPCDGSEPFDVFRRRVEQALAELRLRPLARAGTHEAAMKLAAAAGQFELAARHKQQLDRIRALDTGSPGGAGTFDTYRHAVVTGVAGRPSLSRVWGYSGGAALGVWEAGDASEVVRRALRTPVRVPETPGELEALGVIAAWTRESGRRRVRVVRVLDESDLHGVEDAIRGVTKPSRGSQSESEVEELESGGVM
jgi:DNA polymerase-3 subunit epsilon